MRCLGCFDSFSAIQSHLWLLSGIFNRKMGLFFLIFTSFSYFPPPSLCWCKHQHHSAHPFLLISICFHIILAPFIILRILCSFPLYSFVLRVYCTNLQGLYLYGLSALYQIFGSIPLWSACTIPIFRFYSFMVRVHCIKFSDLFFRNWRENGDRRRGVRGNVDQKWSRKWEGMTRGRSAINKCHLGWNLDDISLGKFRHHIIMEMVWRNGGGITRNGRGETSIMHHFKRDQLCTTPTGRDSSFFSRQSIFSVWLINDIGWYQSPLQHE